MRILNGTFPNRQNPVDTWKYEHEDDFMYGLVVGQLDGLILGYFRGICDRAPSDEESQEMRGTVQAYAQQIKELVDQLKAKRGTLIS